MSLSSADPPLDFLLRQNLVPEASALIRKTALVAIGEAGFVEDPGGVVNAVVSRTFGSLTPEQQTIVQLAVLRMCLTDTECVSQIGGETEQLQKAMDRQSQLVETLSNDLKKTVETSDAIVQNMK
jgi:hypothetical protein